MCELAGGYVFGTGSKDEIFCGGTETTKRRDVFIITTGIAVLL
jgi:hypothetical protein